MRLEINFSHDTIQLVSAKLTKLDALIWGADGYSAKHSSIHRPAHLGHQHCVAFEILASATILGPQQPTLDTASNVVSLQSILEQGSQNQP